MSDDQLPLLGGNIVDFKARQTNAQLKELLVQHVALKNRALDLLQKSNATLIAAGTLLKECREALTFTDEKGLALSQRITELVGD